MASLDTLDSEQSKASSSRPTAPVGSSEKVVLAPNAPTDQTGSKISRMPPTSAEIDAVIAAAMANAPPAPPPVDMAMETAVRSLTPLMTNILPSAIGADGRVNLFVGNLPYRVRWQDLKDLFRKAGTVLRADVSLGPDNRSRGYGNVLMGSREDAARAIDRFNGFTWQTRTLEVRPDRLPPEYEPQPHVHHKPMYGFMPPPMQHFGGGGGGWNRPPPHGPPFGGFGSHLGPPGAHVGPAAAGFGRGPGLAGSSLAPVGASPLAGSLTAGPGGPAGGPGWAPRESLAPYGTVPGGPDHTRSASPGSGLPQLTGEGRPPSPGKLGDHELPIGRAPGGMGRLQPFGAGKNALAPDLEPATVHRPGSSDSTSPALSMVSPPPIALNGLANQGKDLGAPNTLFDRVVFVKNLSLSTQWQDLKDLFRPAGVVIRADVATRPDGQSRGFGTVLFASKDDALNAVAMFNNHEIDGRILHVATERQTLEDKHIQPIHPGSETFPSFGSKPSGQVWGDANPPLPSLNTASDTFPLGGTSATSNPSPTGRVPWQLNTAVVTNPATAALRRNASEDPRQRQARHPGPISLPPFPAMAELNPLSPLQTRALPPMTPSMPGFVFNAYPQTPPVHPQHYLSPGGAGPFSPGLPVTSPVYGGRSPFLNPAPGAPVHRPPQGGSAALGTPTTQAFPQNASHSTAGPPGSQVSDEYFPRVESPQARPAPSPLNARERLASTAGDGDLLASGAAALSLDDSVEESAADSAPNAKSKRSASSAHLHPSGSVEVTPPTNGRSSFDQPRQQGAWSSDRRASWGDLAAGAANR